MGGNPFSAAQTSCRVDFCWCPAGPRTHLLCTRLITVCGYIVQISNRSFYSLEMQVTDHGSWFLISVHLLPPSLKGSLAPGWA